MNITRLLTGKPTPRPLFNRWYRGVLVLATLLVVQCLLLGSVLSGEKLMIGLGILKLQKPAILTPLAPGEPQERVTLTTLDPVLQFEPFRKFVVDEFRNGRLPLWNRYSYCGSPFLANAQSGVFSPYRLIDVTMNSPVSWAWVQLAKGLVAGIGMYLFLRVAFRIRFLPALAAAQLFPLAGFMLYFYAHPHAQAASWLPWVLLGVDRLVRRPGPGWLTMTVLAASACFYSGHPQTTVHVYLLAAIWALGLLAVTTHKRTVKRSIKRGAWLAAAGVLTGLFCGPQLFPTMEYLPYSTRLDNRAAGLASFPVSGASGLMQLVYPYFSGSAKLETSINYNVANHAESVASGSIGMFWALILAPLGIVLARKDKRVWLLAAIALMGLAYNVGIPLLNLPFEHGPLRMLSPNRFVLFTAVALICLGAIGLDRLSRQRRSIPSWAWWPAILPGMLTTATLAWCIIAAQDSASDLTLDPDLRHDAQWFTSAYTSGVILTSLALAGVVLMWLKPGMRRPLAIALGLAGVVEIVVLAWGFYPAAPRDSYYPPIPALQWVHEQTGIQSRATGFQCFGANLNMIYEIPDARGYDALDPAPIVQLLETSRNMNFPRLDPEFGTVMVWSPRPTPVVDMLSLRYLIVRGRPPEKPAPVFVGYDYFVLENTSALPRVYVPRESVVIDDPAGRLGFMSTPGFNASQTLVLDSADTGLPGSPMIGSARLVSDTGSSIVIRASMQTPGVVVLGDMWYPGWHASFTTGNAASYGAEAAEKSQANDAQSSVEPQQSPAQILKVNHALKGILLPAGEHTVTLNYWPRSFVAGLYSAGIAVAGLAIIWAGYLLTNRTRRKSSR